ncbi:hypothetical protein [Thioalkalivibrio sp. ALE19]|uniref:hypothetical protein n=1 Tax=Thioalkalivibrio sp. ALE19 TaxID=1266909 RepID=UPI000490C79B|nr:hypothetical protein [Thioalkalivibrio sp. ALE19]
MRINGELLESSEVRATFVSVSPERWLHAAEVTGLVDSTEKLDEQGVQEIERQIWRRVSQALRNHGDC